VHHRRLLGIDFAEVILQGFEEGQDIRRTSGIQWIQQLRFDTPGQGELDIWGHLGHPKALKTFCKALKIHTPLQVAVEHQQVASARTPLHCTEADGSLCAASICAGLAGLFDMLCSKAAMLQPTAITLGTIATIANYSHQPWPFHTNPCAMHALYTRRDGRARPEVMPGCQARSK